MQGRLCVKRKFTVGFVGVFFFGSFLLYQDKRNEQILHSYINMQKERRITAVPKTKEKNKYPISTEKEKKQQLYHKI
jgi:hypothetical protein